VNAISPRPHLPGRFITLEGAEGVGKSTQLRLLAERIRGLGIEVLETREPGGEPEAERIRNFLLEGKAMTWGSGAEALLFATARLHHMQGRILPALRRGAYVISDRFFDSTRVYQGIAGQVGDAELDVLDRLATNGRSPDLTLIFDLPVEEAMSRTSARRGNAAPDRFEGEAREFHDRLREGFLRIAAAHPERCQLVDAAGADRDALSQRLFDVVVDRFSELAELQTDTEDPQP